MMHGCPKCSKASALMILALGVLFLLVDWGVWTFWNISWWSAIFVLMGLMHLCKSGCKDCQAMYKKR